MKHLEQIVAENAAVAPPPNKLSLNAALLHALKTARASLQDVLQHGASTLQLRNINHTDLPLVQSAIVRLEKEIGR